MIAWAISCIRAELLLSGMQGCSSRGALQVVAAQEQGAPTTTKKRTSGPPILPPINDNVRLTLPEHAQSAHCKCEMASWLCLVKPSVTSCSEMLTYVCPKSLHVAPQEKELQG